MTWYAVVVLPPSQHADAALCAAVRFVSPQLACAAGLITLDLGGGEPSSMLGLARQVQDLATAPTGYAPTIGIAASRVVAGLAAKNAAPGAVRLIAPADHTRFLAPLPIVDLQLTAPITLRLHRLGLHTIGQLATVSLGAIQAQFGAAGRDLFHLARGNDLAPFVPEPIAPLVQVCRRFAGAVTDHTILCTALHQLVARLCQRLDAGAWAAGSLALTLELDDAPILEQARSLAHPTTQERRLLQQVEGLFRAAAPGSGVIAMSVTVPHLVPLVAEQLALIPPDQSQSEQGADLVATLSPSLRQQLRRAIIVAPDAYLAEQRVALRLWDRG